MGGLYDAATLHALCQESRLDRCGVGNPKSMEVQLDETMRFENGGSGRLDLKDCLFSDSQVVLGFQSAVSLVLRSQG